MSEYNFSMLSRGISEKKSPNAQTPFRALVLVPQGKVEKRSFDLTGHLKVAFFARVDWNSTVKHPCSVIKGLFLRWSFLAEWNWANNWLRRFNQSLRPLVQWLHTTPPPMDWSTLSRSTPQSKEVCMEKIWLVSNRLSVNEFLEAGLHVRVFCSRFEPCFH